MKDSGKPIPPTGFSGPASTPRADTLNTLANDPDLLKAVEFGADLSQRSYEKGFDRAMMTNMMNKKTPLWRIVVFILIFIASLVIVFYPSISFQLKLAAYGFLAGQATRLIL